jgi:hypothetical protein
MQAFQAAGVQSMHKYVKKNRIIYRCRACRAKHLSGFEPKEEKRKRSNSVFNHSSMALAPTLAAQLPSLSCCSPYIDDGDGTAVPLG